MRPALREWYQWPKTLPEHAVIVHLVLSDGDVGSEAEQARVWELEDQLAPAIAAARVGQYDGNEIAEGEAVLYMYGPSVDSLFDVVRPLLREFTPLPGSHVIKRYGSAEDLDAPEDTVPLTRHPAVQDAAARRLSRDISRVSIAV